MQWNTAKVYKMSQISVFDKKKPHFLEEGNAVDLVGVDFSEVFDIGPHGKSLVKLEKMEINVRNV